MKDFFAIFTSLLTLRPRPLFSLEKSPKKIPLYSRRLYWLEASIFPYSTVRIPRLQTDNSEFVAEQLDFLR